VERVLAMGGDTTRQDETSKTIMTIQLAALTEEPRWVVWRWEQTKEGKPTKVPYQARRPDVKASSIKPATWASHEEAVATFEKADQRFNGVGICLHGSNFSAFDIDDCRNPETGEIHPWATALVERAGSYTEVTPSGTGLRIIGTTTKEDDKIHRRYRFPARRYPANSTAMLSATSPLPVMLSAIAASST
jgi:hypothetical protein